MMPKLEVKENKKLKLQKVICKELNNIEIEKFDIEINNFLNSIKALKAQVFGPVVIRNKGTDISENGIITSSYEIYIQVHDYLQYKNQFIVKDEISVEYCIYIRYEGKPEYLQLAFNKLEIYEYEEEIITKGDIYMVSLEENEKCIKMDIFKPVKMI
ncbi:AraC family transcriptional regulator [Helcococcus ovis]|uniref:AraC family transcriptional regulator n=2 Tax=Helcococcus ovis TaxID=72026 RepID=UPI0010703393|nr:AraC family transcriptional regulator [Helcococcus ovis]TFF66133.1 AraC family transcriptional regulator [Helcococcus ovis]